ncbi:putative glutathione-specific gamma-glutamylcyclotransferase 2 isoform X1 [Trichogramma pretiosum]|uniref:putative glutathione-specific gamma-glutamylcyclotransferase 2 isoform X1 n=1 Tax=Trichogramma pretiosum TaxID=7493 RepID=UPI0006C96540|nr:putative glutathione-specific gamma-glutamylcyclotransferase 2 isoform X1 [Trichogramma pretiosum]
MSMLIKVMTAYRTLTVAICQRLLIYDILSLAGVYHSLIFLSRSLGLAVQDSKQEKEMWVFGYGSLIWKADFPYEKRVVGHIKGFIRRFYQKSTDHRGVPSRPGRVVTLLSSNNPLDEVWGCAYKIANEDIESVTKHLDYRENMYERVDVLFHPFSNSQAEATPFHLNIYIAREVNPNFAGYEDIDTIASHIAECVGASGHNTEYLYNLAHSMRAIAPKVYDAHLFDLENAVKRIEMVKSKKALEIDRRNHNIAIK